MFDRELKYFIAHQEELVEQHRGKILVLRGESVEGVYDSPLQAYLSAQERFEIGTFMIQPCEPGARAYSVTVSSVNW
jgi:hypothetical protein